MARSISSRFKFWLILAALGGASFGVPFLANPDLPRRFEEAAPLNPADQATFYVGEEKGYTDYPVLS